MTQNYPKLVIKAALLWYIFLLPGAYLHVLMNPLFVELASNYPDFLFLLVDVDEVQVYDMLIQVLAFILKEVASKMEIKAMPTFLFMKEGAPIDKLVGANPEEIRKRTQGFI
ncbi:Thioredoxin [Quillaja saponaria]|uniref:Thioredoxin n=1 Tax=Quillaja saponaria TaxID=32244 RepID=A0AAD7L0D0_QUISA|nr:Thioredoxin [Quillaja saponaria]